MRYGRGDAMLLRISHHTQKQDDSHIPALPLSSAWVPEASPPMLLAGQTLLVLGWFILMALLVAAAGRLIL